MATASNIVYREASLEDLDSLETIIPRAFFPVNEIMKNLFPDTLAMRKWWRGIFEDYIRTPERHLPVAIDTSTGAVIGASVFRGVKRGGPFGGFMADHPATEDHAEIWPEAIREFREHEEQAVGDRGRFLVEIMGVDHAYQRKGVGKQLVAMLCDIADAKGYPIFLETTQAAKFYTNLNRGFAIIEAEDEGAMMLREAAALRQRT